MHLDEFAASKSPRATQDGAFSSASRFTSFGPACLSSGRWPSAYEHAPTVPYFSVAGRPPDWMRLTPLHAVCHLECVIDRQSFYQADCRVLCDCSWACGQNGGFQSSRHHCILP